MGHRRSYGRRRAQGTWVLALVVLGIVAGLSRLPGSMQRGLAGVIAILILGAAIAAVILIVRRAAGIAGRIVTWVPRQQALSHAGAARIATMTGRELEQRLARLFRKLRLSADVVGRGGDFGADLIVMGDLASAFPPDIHGRRPEGGRMLVQAKRWCRPLGPKAVQEAYSAMPHWHCPEAAVVTNAASFTKEAKQMGLENGVLLYDQERLQDMLVREQWS